MRRTVQYNIIYHVQFSVFVVLILMLAEIATSSENVRSRRREKRSLRNIFKPVKNFGTVSTFAIHACFQCCFVFVLSDKHRCTVTVCHPTHPEALSTFPHHPETRIKLKVSIPGTLTQQSELSLTQLSTTTCSNLVH
jgi:hypothetical protein